MLALGLKIFFVQLCMNGKIPTIGIDFEVFRSSASSGTKYDSKSCKTFSNAVNVHFSLINKKSSLSIKSRVSQINSANFLSSWNSNPLAMNISDSLPSVGNMTSTRLLKKLP